MQKIEKKDIFTKKKINFATHTDITQNYEFITNELVWEKKDCFSYY